MANQFLVAWYSQFHYTMAALMDGNKTRFRVAGKFLSLVRSLFSQPVSTLPRL
jgi:hypothetical protein